MAYTCSGIRQASGVQNASGGYIYLKSMCLKSIAKSMLSIGSESGDSILNGHQANNISITKWLQL